MFQQTKIGNLTIVELTRSGRPAILFMMLAGIGISLRFDRYGQTPVVEPNVARFRLLKRGTFFLDVATTAERRATMFNDAPPSSLMNYNERKQEAPADTVFVLVVPTSANPPESITGVS